MANPQKENGYTPIANEILEHLSLSSLSGSEFRILLVVIRKTYGFNKKADRISLSQFSKFTGMKHANTVKTLKMLVVNRLLVKANNLYSFNKKWDEWVVVKRLPPQKGSSQLTTEVVVNRLPKVVVNRLHTKDKRHLSKERGAENGVGKPPPPSAKEFFESKEMQEKIVTWLVEKGATEESVRHELGKFVSYWTEPNGSGKLVRWEGARFFDVRRRLTTWFGNVVKYNGNKQQNKGRGIII